MPNIIVHAFTWTLHLLFPARGRHRAPEPPAPVAIPVPPAQAPPWSRPWTGPSADTARAIFTADEAQDLTREQRERFYATAWAELGWDYPCTAEGVHQVSAEVTP
ncbi:hypothetical protein ACWD4V_07575 [Streptomyces tsukubensis]|uniref:hypothetical protein n=1 Tax=Streptomyces tsukubensis TaxID=83656 RepID=UPI0036970944